MALVQALDAVRERLGIGRWHICGQSFGAGLTLRYALDFPRRCIGHAFTNGNAALRREWPEEARSAHRALVARIRAEGRAALRRMRYHPAHARRFPSDIREMLCVDADLADPEGFALLQQAAIPELSVAARLDELEVPTLLINGVQERRFQSTRDWLAAAHPAIEIVDLDGGHSINVERPEPFNHALTKFLKRQEARRAIPLA